MKGVGCDSESEESKLGCEQEDYDAKKEFRSHEIAATAAKGKTELLISRVTPVCRALAFGIVID
jgi:hypothetical protein